MIGRSKAHEACLEALKDLAVLIEDCTHCEGTGTEPDDSESACGVCGGQGRVLHVCTAYISDIEDAIEKSVAEAEGRE